jgi:hypothetical protein
MPYLIYADHVLGGSAHTDPWEDPMSENGYADHVLGDSAHTDPWED